MQSDPGHFTVFEANTLVKVSFDAAAALEHSA
jgi:hypothetical protein